MKKTLYSTLAIASLLGIFGCSDPEEEFAENFSFTVDGTEKNYTSSIIVTDYSGTYGVWIEAAPSTSTSNVEGFTIILPYEGTDTYTEQDYKNMGSNVQRPNIKYQDRNGNEWQYFNYEGLNFTINVTTYNYESGEIAGTFSGKLYGVYGNGSNAPLTIEIKNGSFSHTGITTGY